MKHLAPRLLIALSMLLARSGDGQQLAADCPHEPVTAEAAECYYQSARKHGTYAEAISETREMLAARPNLPWLQHYLGHMYFETGPCNGESAAAYERAAQLFLEEGEVADAANSTISLAWNQARCRETAQAEETLRSAEALLGQTKDRPILRTQLELLRLRIRMAQGGDLEAVYTALAELKDDTDRRARDGNRPSENEKARRLEKESLRALGTLAHYLGRYDEAQSWARLRWSAAQNDGDRQAERSAGFDLDLARAAAGGLSADVREVIGRQLEATVADSAANGSVKAKAYLQLARWESSESAARKLLARCLAETEGRRDFRQARRCRLATARLEVQRDGDEARRLLQQIYSEDAAQITDDLWLRVDGWRDQLFVLWHTFPEPERQRRIDGILTAIEHLKHKQKGMARPDILHARSDAFYGFAGLLLRREPRDDEALRQAFAVLERLRAQDLRDALDSTDPSPRTHPPLDLLGQDLLGQDLLDQVTAQLGPREAMVSFQIAPDEDFYGREDAGSWVWLSTRQGTEVHRLGSDRGAFEAKIETMRHGAWQGDDLSLLYEHLLAPVVDSLPMDIDRLVIVPDGILHLLPFAALGPRESPLAARFELTVAPSASLWLHWRRATERTAPSAVLVFADPTPSVPQELSSDPSRWPPRWRRGALGPLPHARREGKKVVKAVGGRSKLFQGEDAGESVLRRFELDAADMLHFATHAFADTEQPERSGVLLAAGQGEDGWLQPDEIARLDLHGKVVVLSTCDSAAGTWRRGEGVISLARAFFQAGAQAVVATLRPVSDDPTARFFDSFYTHLKSGADLSSALATTQRQWIADGELTSTWANIMVLGNGDWTLNRPPAESRLQTLVPWILGSVGVLLLLLIMGRRVHRS